MSSYKTLAFDQSSAITGWAYFEGQELKEFGKFNSGGGLSEFVSQVSLLLERFQPNKVVAEDIYASLNLSTFKKLAQVQGALIVAVGELDLEFIYPTQWKSSQQVGGRNRTEQKRAAKQKVLERYKVKATNDEADAILLGAHMTQQELNFE